MKVDEYPCFVFINTIQQYRSRTRYKNDSPMHVDGKSGVLEDSILAYADQMKEQQKRAYEQASRENRPPGQYWVETEPPKVSQKLVPQRNYDR